MKGSARTCNGRAVAMLMALVAITGCSKPEPSGAVEQAPSANQPQLGSRPIQVRSAENQLAITLLPDKNGLGAEYEQAGARVSLEARNKGERRLYTKDGLAFAEARTRGNTTKITSPSGVTLWVLKQAGRRLRVARGDAEASPVIIARPSPDRLRVMRDESELGRVTHDASHSRTKVREPEGRVVFDCIAPGFSSMYGVLLMPDLSADDRAVLMSEILLLGY